MTEAPSLSTWRNNGPPAVMPAPLGETLGRQASAALAGRRRAALAPFYAAAPCSRSRARCTWCAPCRLQRPPVRVRCPVAFSLSATLAHERPPARCSMIATRVSCSPWCHARRPSMNCGTRRAPPRRWRGPAA